MKYLATIIFCILVLLQNANAQTPICTTCEQLNLQFVPITNPIQYQYMESCTSDLGQYRFFYQKNSFKWYENSYRADWEFKIMQNLNPGGSTYLVAPAQSPFVDASSNNTFPYLPTPWFISSRTN